MHEPGLAWAGRIAANLAAPLKSAGTAVWTEHSSCSSFHPLVPVITAAKEVKGTNDKCSQKSNDLERPKAVES